MVLLGVLSLIFIGWIVWFCIEEKLEMKNYIKQTIAENSDSPEYIRMMMEKEGYNSEEEIKYEQILQKNYNKLYHKGYYLPPIGASHYFKYKYKGNEETMRFTIRDLEDVKDSDRTAHYFMATGDVIDVKTGRIYRELEMGLTKFYYDVEAKKVVRLSDKHKAEDFHCYGGYLGRITKKDEQVLVNRANLMLENYPDNIVGRLVADPYAYTPYNW